MCIRQSVFQVRRLHLERILRLAAAALVCAGLTGCGVGVLIGGAVVGALLALDDGGSSGGGVASIVNVAIEAPSRPEMREKRDATTIPLRISSTGEVGRISVEYSREGDGFAMRYTASGDLGPPDDDGERTFLWDAGADFERFGIDLIAESRRVKVHALVNGVPLADTGPFPVGNSEPEVSFRQVILPSEPGGTIQVSVEVRDDDGDPLIEPELKYREVGCEEWKPVCDGSPAASGDCRDSRDSQYFDCAEECEPCPEPPENRLSVGRITRFSWRPKCVEEIGQRNVDVEIMLEARDDFGRTASVWETLPLRNNSPPEVDILPGQDQSFEIPILYNLFERDCADFQAVDIVVQYDPEGGRGFEPLDDRFDDPGFRRRVLDPASSDFGLYSLLRRELRIATPHSSRPVTAQLFDLTASEDGVQHTFLWDSAEDIPPSAFPNVTVQITPYNEDAGVSSVAPIRVDNDFYPSQTHILQGRQSVGGIAFGDLDGDRRDDQVYSLTQEGALMICLSTQEGGARIAQGCGVLPLEERPSSPAALEIADLDGDGENDLVVLNRRCDLGPCRSRGVIEIYFGIPGGENGLGVEATPAVKLETGEDARSICVGNFDGAGGLDIAVSSRDDFTIGIFLSIGRRSYTKSSLRLEVVGNERPGSITCADFDGDGLDEFAVRLREANLVNVYEWDLASERIIEVSSTDDVTSPASLDTADFDGDGWIDLAVGSRDPPCIHLLKNRGGDSPSQPGQFRRVCQVDLESPAELVGVSRLVAQEADEYLLASAGDDITNRVELVRFRFSEQDCGITPLKSPTFPQPSNTSNLRGSLAVRDFDGDGLADVLVGGRDGALFLRAEGPGSFAGAPLEELALPGVDALVFADLSCDSLADITAVNRLQTDEDGNTFYEASFFLQDPFTGFSQSADWVSDPQPSAELGIFISTGDRDGDGCTDVIAVSRTQGIDFFLREDSSFPADFSVSPRSIEVTSLFTVPFVLGSFGGNGELDVLVLDPDSGELALRTLNFRDGAEDGIDDRTHDEVIETGRRSFRLLTGDLQGNGLLDVVMTHKDPDREALSIRRQVPDRPWPQNFVEEPAPVLPEGFFLESGDTSLLVDVNSDGRNDLVFAGPGKPLVVFLSTGESGSFFRPLSASPVTIPATLDGAPIDTVAVADLSNDDRPDLIISSRSGQDAILSILYQRKDGTFLPSASRTIVVSLFGRGIVRVGVSDLTGDSRPEVIVFGAGANATWIGRSR